MPFALLYNHIISCCILLYLIICYILLYLVPCDILLYLVENYCILYIIVHVLYLIVRCCIFIVSCCIVWYLIWYCDIVFLYSPWYSWQKYSFGVTHQSLTSFALRLQQDIRDHDTSFFDTSSNFTSGNIPLCEESEMNDRERQRNQLISIQYQQRLLRMQQCKRSNSVLVSW